MRNSAFDGRRARRAGVAVLVAVSAQLLLLAQPAAAAQFQTEADALHSGSFRNTYVFDPGQHNFVDRSRLFAGDLRSYYAGLGFDANFLTWAPERQLTPDANTEWSGCDAAAVHLDQLCPVMPVHYKPIRDYIGTGSITVWEWNGHFISRLCGNHSEAGGSAPPPVISGMKFEDVNGDGARSAGEPGLGGWNIQLTQDGNVVAATSTGGDGSYRFVLDANNLNLHGGTFTVQEVNQAGWVASRAPGAVNVPYGSAQIEFGGNDFGNYRPATISGGKVEDLDADGSTAGDPGVAGWRIDLTGPTAGSTTTDSGGGFTFAGLRPGRYTVSEEQRAGWFQSAPAAGTFTMDVHSGETVADATFANWRPATISGRKFDDHNVDGTGTGDPGLPGWTVDGGAGTSPQTTGAGGVYTLAGLRPGTYVGRGQQQDGWRQTAPAAGTHTVTVRSNDVVDDRDFGNVCLADVQVVVHNRTTGANVTGLELRLEEVSVPGILANDPALPRTTTSGGFVGLLPGTYRLTAFLPDGVFTTDPDVALVDGRWAIVKTIIAPECTDARVDLDVVTGSEGKVTGGMRMDVPGGFATAGFEFMTQKGEPRGSLEFQDHALGLNLHTKLIDNITVIGNEAWIWGRVTVGGVEQRFRLHLVDAGEPGTSDRFELGVAPSYQRGYGQIITGGNVQIHKVK
jgi:hypothetical protein